MKFSRDARRLRLFHIIAWGLAIVPCLLLAMSAPELRAELWGVWLYIGLAAATLTLELLLIARERRAGRIDGEIPSA